MTAPSDKEQDKEPRRSRVDLAREIVKEYVDDLSEIIKKLRRKLQ